MMNGPMKLISWNVQRAVGSRADAQIDALATREPSIVALQEVTPTSILHYKRHLERIGLPYVATSFELAPEQGTLVGPRASGQLMGSQWPLQALPPIEFNIPWPECVLSVVCTSPWGDIELHTTHIPPGSSNGWKKIETLEGIYQRLARNSEQPRILCGDFNTPQAETSRGKVVSWAYRQVSGVPESELRYKSGRNARWDKGELNVLQGLSRYDLPDVYRLCNTYDIQEYSYYDTKKGHSVGRRYDHIFASKRLHPVDCLYLHTMRETRLSDHAPIEATFRPQQT